MRELSLFSGAGGGLLGTKLLGWETVGYVEFNDYCQRVLKQRILDGIFDKAPIFGDIRTFIGEGYAESYKGMVDVITAGFPCQPFSVAGKGLGVDDPRNMWPATKDCISIIRSQFCLLENVPGLLTHGYIRRIFGDLAEMGYDCKWGVIGAHHAGAIHKRDRLWIVAHSNSNGKSNESFNEYSRQGKLDEDDSNTKRSTWSQWSSWSILRKDCGTCGKGRDQKKRCKNRFLLEMGKADNSIPYIETVKSCICGMDDDVDTILDRLKAIGNGQVPAVVKTAWEILSGTL